MFGYFFSVSLTFSGVLCVLFGFLSCDGRKWRARLGISSSRA
jgi:hypothetical protein